METIKEAIERLAGNGKTNGLVVARVKKVDAKAMVCDCDVTGAPDYLGCRLMPTVSSGDVGVKVTPKKGSYVVLGFENGRDIAPLVLMVSEVDDYDWMIDGLFSFRNASGSLKKILADILSALETLTVSTGVGPSGTPLPPTIQKITALKMDIDNLMKK